MSACNLAIDCVIIRGQFCVVILINMIQKAAEITPGLTDDRSIVGHHKKYFLDDLELKERRPNR